MRPCRYPLLLAMLAAGLTACGDSTDPDDDPLPDNAATAVGLTVRDNVEASLDAFYPARLLQPLTTGAAQEPCATASTPADTDGDGVPDDATYIFTAPPCRFPDVRGFSLDVVGQLRVVDPAPETAGFGAVVDFTNFRFTLTADDADAGYLHGAFRRGRREITVELRPVRTTLDGTQRAAGSLVRVDIEATRPRATVRARITRQADHLLATADWNGALVSRRAGRLEPFDETPFIAKALERPAGQPAR